jgi:hypothetical protein
VTDDDLKGLRGFLSGSSPAVPTRGIVGSDEEMEVDYPAAVDDPRYLYRFWLHITGEGPT